MDVLDKQIKELLKKANELRLIHVDNTSVGTLFAAIVAMRDAADTIESLQDLLNEVADKWAKAQTKAEDYARKNMLLKIDNDTRWYELFGTPERAALTLSEAKGLCNWCDVETCAAGGGECRIYSYNALFKWLHEEGEKEHERN